MEFNLAQVHEAIAEVILTRVHRVRDAG